MKRIFASLAFVSLAGLAFVSCSDECAYLKTNTDNPAFSAEGHPETLAKTQWVRAAGIKKNVYGETVQGFVESLNFKDSDSVIVKMSKPEYPASWSDNEQITWVDESNDQLLPCYEYTYAPTTGVVEILKRTINDKGAVTKTAIFTGVAAGTGDVTLTVCHFGDTPSQTYMKRQ